MQTFSSWFCRLRLSNPILCVLVWFFPLYHIIKCPLTKGQSVSNHAGQQAAFESKSKRQISEAASPAANQAASQAASRPGSLAARQPARRLASQPLVQLAGRSGGPGATDQQQNHSSGAADRRQIKSVGAADRRQIDGCALTLVGAADQQQIHGCALVGTADQQQINWCALPARWLRLDQDVLKILESDFFRKTVLRQSDACIGYLLGSTRP